MLPEILYLRMNVSTWKVQPMPYALAGRLQLSEIAFKMYIKVMEMFPFFQKDSEVENFLPLPNRLS